MASLTTSSKRNINVELLRILAMLMVVFGHRVGHGGVYEASIGNINSADYFTYVFSFSFLIPVHLFYIISGYFLVGSKPKVKKIYNVWRTVLFYSVLMFLVSIVLKFIVNREFGQEILINLGFDPIRLEEYYLPSWNSFFGNIRSIENWIDAFFPISRSAYGFFSCYCALYLFSPVLNKCLRAINKKQYHYLLAVSFLTVSVLPTIFYTDFLATSSTGGFIWAVFIYIVAGYLRLHFDIHSVKRRNYLLTYVGLIVLRSFSYIVLDNIAVALGKERATWSGYFYGHDNFILVIATACLLCYFLTMECKPKKFDGFLFALSSATFGIYLMHDNLTTRTFMWDLLSAERYAGTSLMWPLVIIDVLVIFLVCGTFDCLRQLIFKKWDKLSANLKLTQKRDMLFNKIDSIFAD